MFAFLYKLSPSFKSYYTYVFDLFFFIISIRFTGTLGAWNYILKKFNRIFRFNTMNNHRRKHIKFKMIHNEINSTNFNMLFYYVNKEESLTLPKRIIGLNCVCRFTNKYVSQA